MKAALLALLVACGGSNSEPPDAAKAIDAKPVDAAIAVDAAPVHGTAKSHTLFLNAEGTTFAPGADDATMHTSSIVQSAGSVVGYMVGDANRTTEIASIVTAIQTVFAPYGITVTTTRPAAGPYDEIVLTDDPSNKMGLGLPAGVIAIVSTSCNNDASVIGFQFPKIITDTTQRHVEIINNAIAMFGNLGGIPSSKTPGDCMCWIDNGCFPAQANAICTIGGATTMTDLGNSGVDACGVTATTFDEGAAFLAAFGAH